MTHTCIVYHVNICYMKIHNINEYFMLSARIFLTIYQYFACNVIKMQCDQIPFWMQYCKSDYTQTNINQEKC